MAIDEGKIGRVAAQLMEELSDAYGEDAELETVFLIAAVDHGDENTIHYKASPGTSKHLGLGLLAVVSDAVRSQ